MASVRKPAARPRVTRARSTSPPRCAGRETRPPGAAAPRPTAAGPSSEGGWRSRTRSRTAHARPAATTCVTAPGSAQRAGARQGRAPRSDEDVESRRPSGRERAPRVPAPARRSGRSHCQHGQRRPRPSSDRAPPSAQRRAVSTARRRLGGEQARGAPAGRSVRAGEADRREAAASDGEPGHRGRVGTSPGGSPREPAAARRRPPRPPRGRTLSDPVVRGRPRRGTARPTARRRHQRDGRAEARARPQRARRRGRARARSSTSGRSAPIDSCDRPRTATSSVAAMPGRRAPSRAVPSREERGERHEPGRRHLEPLRPEVGRVPAGVQQQGAGEGERQSSRARACGGPARRPRRRGAAGRRRGSPPGPRRSRAAPAPGSRRPRRDPRAGARRALGEEDRARGDAIMNAAAALRGTRP